MNTIFSKCLFVIFIALLFISCAEEDIPVANFSIESTDLNKGESVVFTNLSENASYYQWDFGDDTYSFEESPTHKYTSVGTYDITLVAIGNDLTDTASISVAVTTDYDVAIYPGSGIDGVNIYDQWSDIESIYSSSDTSYYINYNSTYSIYYKYVYYYDEGLAFLFLSYDEELSSSDYCYLIYIYSPFDGATADGIKIGSSLSEIENAYGTPSEYDGSSYMCYYYDDLGIEFFTSSESTTIDEIAVYESEETSSNSTSKIIQTGKKEIIRQFRRMN